MSFEITFDYRFDSSGFFDAPERRAALEAAAALWEGVIADEFDAVPTGISFEVRNPSAPDTFAPVTLAAPIDDLLVFVGAAALDDALAQGAPTGYSAAGDVFASRISGDFRGAGPVTDFEPWAGSITFDPAATWSFELVAPAPGVIDFLTVAAHELGHVLGFGTAAIFDALAVDGSFTGVNARALAGAPVPLEDDDSHIADGVLGDDHLMLAHPPVGVRRDIGALDAAMLADIGYEIAGTLKQGARPALATDGPETIFGTVLADTLGGLGGDDQIAGNAGDDALTGGPGDDTLFGQAGDDRLTGNAGDDQLQGGPGDDTLAGGPGDDTLFGQDGTDLFVVVGGAGQTTIADFDPATERLSLVDSGYETVAAALAAIVKPAANLSRLPLPEGGAVDIFHTAQSGTPLTAASIELGGAVVNAPPAGDVTLWGTPAPGQGLTVDTSALDDADGMGPLAYLWLRDGVAIPGATAMTYVPGPDDAGASLQARVSYTDGLGTDEQVTSAPVSVGDVFTGTAGPDAFLGTAGPDAFVGAAGNDTLTGGAADDVIDGGPGQDTARYSGPKAAHTVILSPGGATVIDRRPDGDGRDSLMDVERLDFADGPWSLTAVSGATALSAADLGALVEVYIGYFDRAPDALGLYFWGTAHAQGLSLEKIAELFFDQAETRALYPGIADLAAPTSADLESFAREVYQNVLGRPFDEAGLDFWVGTLSTGAISPALFLLEMIRGAKAPAPPDADPAFAAQKAADVAYLEQKTDIGLYFSVVKGLSDVSAARSVMADYDGSAASIADAREATEAAHLAAQTVDDPDFLLPLVGIVEDPFAV